MSVQPGDPNATLIAAILKVGNKIVTALDDFNANFATFQTDFTTASNQITQALQDLVAAGVNSPAIETAAQALATLDTSVKNLGSTAAGDDPGAPPTA